MHIFAFIPHTFLFLGHAFQDTRRYKYIDTRRRSIEIQHTQTTHKLKMGATPSRMRRRLAEFYLKQQFPDALKRLHRKQHREGLTELDLKDYNSVRSHSQINTIRNRMRDWECIGQAWMKEPRAQSFPANSKLSSQPFSSSSSQGACDGVAICAWLWVCALLASVARGVGSGLSPGKAAVSSTPTRVCFNDVLVEFSTRKKEEGDEREAQEAHDAHDANEALEALDILKPLCHATDLYRLRPAEALVDTVTDTRFHHSSTAPLKAISPADLNGEEGEAALHARRLEGSLFALSL